MNKYFFRPSPHPQGTMWGCLVASRCIFILITTLLGHRNTATTNKLDFKNSHMTFVGATSRFTPPSRGRVGVSGRLPMHIYSNYGPIGP